MRAHAPKRPCSGLSERSRWVDCVEKPQNGGPRKTRRNAFAGRIPRSMPARWHWRGRPWQNPKSGRPPASFFKKPAHGPDFSGSGAKMGFFNTIGRKRTMAWRPEADPQMRLAQKSLLTGPRLVGPRLVAHDVRQIADGQVGVNEVQAPLRLRRQQVALDVVCAPAFG